MPTDFAGRRIGPYQIGALIGSGGMGEVYAAHDSRLGRTVAIKILKTGTESDPVARDRFEREARAIAAISHPHICVLHDIGRDEDVDFLVMEHLPGETLAARLAKGPLPPDQVVGYAIQMARALSAAHGAGILHRDLKPSNVIVGADGHLKVLDFGLAKPAPLHQAETVTRTGVTEIGSTVGTIAYMSPEQARGESVDARSDLFSLGAVVYEMAAGRAAFPRRFDWSSPPPVAWRALQRIIDRLLEPDVEKRYPSAEAVLHDLAALQRAPTAPVFGPRRLAAVIAIAAVAVAAGWLLFRRQAIERPVTSSEKWTPLTKFADSVSHPALSADGRLLAFIRGGDAFAGAPGEIYVKVLPDGEAVQLTRDGTRKMGPAFSPDGTRLAYTVVSGDAWDTWVIPMPGGQPRPWLTNASGLVWIGAGKRLLFSEIKNNDIHMAIVTADENRASARDVYVPAGPRDMAHRSYLSPDGKWVLIVEMARGDWQPCRLVSLDGSAPSRQVGQPGAECTAAAWSIDGRWMYLNSNPEGAFQIFRQEFPAGRIEPVTSGPTEAEGIAMAPDGNSLITAVAQRQSAIVLHDTDGERQVSGEGYSFDPRFTADGNRLVYRVLRGGTLIAGESGLRVHDIAAGRDEPLAPEVTIVGRHSLVYDVSPDGATIATAEADHHNGPIWIVPLDRRSAPRRLPGIGGSRPVFSATGEIIFDVVSADRQSSAIYGVKPDGTGLRRVLPLDVVGLRGITADRRWLLVRARDGQGTYTAAFPLEGGPPVRLASGAVNDFQWKWSPGGETLVLSGPTLAGSGGRSFIIPLARGQMFPDLPAGGFTEETQFAAVAGTRRVPGADVVPGDRSGRYVFSRLTVQRNLFRIPLK